MVEGLRECTTIIGIVMVCARLPWLLPVIVRYYMCERAIGLSSLFRLLLTVNLVERRT
jgi:hypothetical protein